MPDAVLQGLSDAPALLASALSLLPPPRPYDRVEVALHSGEHTRGEAMSVGAGCIRLSLGEGTSAGEAAGIARHEALHLLLATSLRGGERWIGEPASGRHYLGAAGNLPVEEAAALRAIVLDDWLLDYEQYSRAVSNPPSGAGHVFGCPRRAGAAIHSSGFPSPRKRCSAT